MNTFGLTAAGPIEVPLMATARPPSWTTCCTLGLFAFLLGGCRVDVEPLMPSPVLYTDGAMEPFPRLAPHQHRPTVDILYATNRARNDDWRVIEYANDETGQISLGAAAVRIGGPGMTWNELVAASTSADRDTPIPIELAGIYERGGFPVSAPLSEPDPDTLDFLDAIDTRVAASSSGDAFIYVHGATVNFYNACAFTGQMAHFMGRDTVGIAFAWPTRQNIVAYGTGGDVRRAYESADALASLIEFVAARSSARRIHVLSWSAGARVVSSAMTTLRERHPEQSPEDLRRTLRIGTVFFAAGDIPLSEFLARIDDVHSLSDRVVVSITDEDGALSQASRFMGGGRRLGQHGRTLAPDERARIEALERLEVVDVSHGSQDRGFSIHGHRYWFNHPWCSTDTLLALRSGLPAADRGLVQIQGWRCAWAFPNDYPERVRNVVERIRADAPPPATSNP